MSLSTERSKVAGDLQDAKLHARLTEEAAIRVFEVGDYRHPEHEMALKAREAAKDARQYLSCAEILLREAT